MALPASDNFNRADGGLGANWATNSGTLVIESNVVRGTAASTLSSARWSADSFSANQYSQITVSAALGGGLAYAAVRMSTAGATTFYGAQLNVAGSLYLDKVVAGATTHLASDSGWAMGDTLRLEVVGTTLNVYRNGMLRLSATDSSISNGAAGIAYFANATPASNQIVIDNWTGGDLVALTATPVSTTQVNLAWNDNETAETGWSIERAVGAGAFSEIATVAANSTSYSDTTVTEGAGYSYRVRAYTGAVYAAYSNTATATTHPSAPTTLSALAVSDIQIDLAWTDTSGGETGFRIERAVGAGAFSEFTTVAANVASYSDTGRTANTAYSYRVRAYNGTGNSSYSNTASATTLQTPISLTVEIAFASDPFAASPTWVDVTSRVRVDEPIIIRRGRQNELGRIEPGRLSLTMDNRDRALDPLNTSSPYYPNVKPRRHIRVSATWDGETHRLYTGYCRFSNNWGVADNTCRVDAVDALDMFARMPLVEQQIAIWSPGSSSTTITTYVSYAIAGGGVVRAKLSEAPATSQTITWYGLDSTGTPTSDSITLTSSNWTVGAFGTSGRVFRTITQIDSTNASSTHRSVTLTYAPAFSGGLGFKSEDHLADIMAFSGYPSGLTVIQEGAITMAPWSAGQISDTSWSRSTIASGVSDTVLGALQRVTETEGGLCYVRGDGMVMMEALGDRLYSYYPGASTLGSAADEIPYRDPTFEDGDAYVANQVRLAGTTAGQSAADATTVEMDAYGRRPYLRTGLLYRYPAEQLAAAQRLLYHRKAAVPRVTGLTIDADTSNFSTVLGWDISTPVTVRLRPPGAPTSYDKPSWVESLEWRITRNAWTLKLGLSPAELGNDLYRTISGAGMAFPTSPYLDQVFYRNDLDLLCYYDGTRWLTVNEYTVALGPTTALPISAAPQGLCITPMRSDYSAYVTRVSVLSYVLTTNNGSNYWSLILRRDSTALHSPTTAAQAANTWTRSEASVNAAHTGTYFELISSSKTGSPGNLYGAATVNYRLIIT